MPFDPLAESNDDDSLVGKLDKYLVVMTLSQTW